jgi:thiol-disulfide isomerase/thioredoxin
MSLQRFWPGLMSGLQGWLKDWRSHVLTLVTVLLVYAGIHLWQTRDLPGGAAPVFSAPQASAQTLGTIDLAQWRAGHSGRAVALHFWADWCPICRMEQDSISRVQRDWPVLGVAMQSGDASRIQTVLRKRQLDWLTAIDPDGTLARRYGLTSVPAFIVLDAQGRIRFAEVGYTTEAGMRLRLWWAQTF